MDQLSKVNPAVPLMVTARELSILRRAVPYGVDYGKLSEKMNQAERESRAAVREARRKEKGHG